MKTRILPIILLLLILPVAQAAFVGHSAESITEGTFRGNYNIDGTLQTTTTTGFSTTYAINKGNTPLRRGELVSITFEEPTTVGGTLLFGVTKTTNKDVDIIGVVYKQVDDNLKPTEEIQIHPGDKLLIATQGPVETLKVTTQNGAIIPGDYLTTSNIAGAAMKADSNSNILIGRALQTIESGDGTISAFISITTNDRATNINQERLQKHDTLPKEITGLGITKEPLGSTEQPGTSALQQQINALQEQIKQLQAQLASLFGITTPETPVEEPVVEPEEPITTPPEVPEEPVEEPVVEPEEPIITPPEPEEPSQPGTTTLIQLGEENIIIQIG